MTSGAGSTSVALPAPIIPMDEVALIDAAAEAMGISLSNAMEQAGAALAAEARRMAPAGPFLVVCGSGNNGGDGYVCARILLTENLPVRVWAVTPPVTTAAQLAAQRFTGSVDNDIAITNELSSHPPPALIIDALVGAGLRGRPHGVVATAIQRLRTLTMGQAGRPVIPVLAADVPSGLGTDVVLPASRAVCYGAVKAELVGSSACRSFFTVDVGIPPAAMLEVQPVCARRFPPLLKNAHKGSHGEVLIIGGGPFPGALEFAGRAALMTGCDLVRGWTTGQAYFPPTFIIHRQASAGNDSLGPAEAAELSPLLVRAGCLLIGPGLGRSPPAQALARQAVSLALELGVPVVIDADALTACAELVRTKPSNEDRLVLTPHRGEARELIGSNDEAAIHAFARRDRVILAKAPVDLITDGQRWQRNPRGNPRLTVGGSGDVLAGLTAGLLARGMTPFDAARLAVLWLTTAGDQLWIERGPTYDPLDILAQLPFTLRELLSQQHAWPPMRS